MTSEDLYKMELHETWRINYALSVTRVPGGWLYRLRYRSEKASVTFVPFNDEFNPWKP